MEPANSFSASHSLFKFTNSLIRLGIVPVKPLKLAKSFSNDPLRSNISAVKKIPEKLFCSMSKTLRGEFPIPDGIPPLILFEKTSIEVKVVMPVKSSSGKVPVRLLVARGRAWRIICQRVHDSYRIMVSCACTYRELV